MEISNHVQLKELIKNNPKCGSVGKAINHEDRIRFHVETEIDNMGFQRRANDFLNWVESLIPKDKFEIFLHLFRVPLFTNDITEKIFNQLERVFESKNPFFNYHFSNPDLKSDWDEYRINVLKDNTFWRTKGWDAYKTAINSVIVIDLPKEQQENRPSPYYYLLDIRNVVSYELRPDKECFEWFMFEYDKEKDQKAIFCDKYYRIVTVKGTELKTVDFESVHDLGFVPAKFFWTTALRKSEPDIKRSDLSNQLGQLDKLLFKFYSKDHLDLYASYPIYSAYEQDCDYEMIVENGENSYHDVCYGGFIKRDGNYVLSGTGLMKCPRCSEKNLSGAGSLISVRPPSEENNYKDLREPVTITTIDRDSLDYNVEEIERLKDEIIESVVGGGGEPKNDQAKNEKQITAGFEEKTTILQKIAWNFERAQKFANDTVCLLRYETGFVGSNLSWGKDFYVYTTEELRKLYKNAKENNLSMSELDMILKQIISTEYKNNPLEYKRMLILMDLEPYRHLSLEEIRSLKQDGLITNVEDLQIKINFANFIARFERENTNVVDFGSLLKYDKKIDKIKSKLIEYGKEREKATTG